MRHHLWCCRSPLPKLFLRAEGSGSMQTWYQHWVFRLLSRYIVSFPGACEQTTLTSFHVNIILVPSFERKLTDDRIDNRFVETTKAKARLRPGKKENGLLNIKSIHPLLLCLLAWLPRRDCRRLLLCPRGWWWNSRLLRSRGWGSHVRLSPVHDWLSRATWLHRYRVGLRRRRVHWVLWIRRLSRDLSDLVLDYLLRSGS